MLNEINNKKFEKELKPIFNKFKFSSDKPFILPSFQKKEDYDSYFYTIYHAAIYKTITFIQDFELSLEEYVDIYKRYIHKETVAGSTTIYYQNKAILKIEPYRLKDGNKTEAIYPLNTDLINFDKEVLSTVEKEKEEIGEWNKDFNNKNIDDEIDFDDF